MSYKIAVVGHPRSAVGYKLGIVYEILKQFFEIDDYTQNFNLSSSIKSVLDYYATEIQFSSITNNINIVYFEDGYNPVKRTVATNEFVSKSNLFFSHSNLRDIYLNDLYQDISYIIFTYRDCRDFIVSNIKYICANSDTDASGYISEKMSMLDKKLFYTTMGAFTQYNIKDTDMSLCTPIIRHFSKYWREYMLDYISLENEDKIKLFPFEDKYKFNFNDEVISLLKLFNLDNTALNLLSIDEQSFGFVNSKKIGKYIDFFKKSELDIIQNIAGDVLVYMGYFTLEEYSSFIYQNDNFSLIVDPDIDLKLIQNFFDKFNKKIKEVISLNENLVMHEDATYLLMTEKSIIMPSHIKHEYYPYYNNCIDINLFDLKNNISIRLSNLLTHYKNIQVIYHSSASFEWNIFKKFVKEFELIKKSDYTVNDASTIVVISNDIDNIISTIDNFNGYTLLTLYPLYHLKNKNQFVDYKCLN